MEGWNKNSNNWKNKIKTLMFGRKRQEFQCVEAKNKNSNVKKDNIRILMFARVRQEF